ncbi:MULTISPECIES: ATP-binding cassette domain-containing protein [unclassified Vibrio]|uniref:ATP-binding cassette domain-containing protein n=1 Tax=Vibrio sp. HB236076 TaxID=3232307 RepID=A0AB39HCW7_9VIBR|nr:ATP-binding cassette domain-containing protein [Vibrio sp. HB161653]MDP5254064.1 ATP-binding cassette domain-containing protein [Vibrio sp. HB161653]
MNLVLDNIAIFNGDTPLLTINETVGAGEVLTIMGPSGVGKSTLLDVISGQLQAPFHYTGSVKFGDNALDSMPSHLRKIGVLYQDALLFEHFTVEQNIAFAMNGAKASWRKAEQQHWIAEQLSQIGLAKMAKRSVDTLSGGQQARVALLRTLASEPNAVLLDEPFSKLDTSLRQQIRDWVFEQLSERGLPAVLVTHDKEDSAMLNGQVIEV